MEAADCPNPAFLPQTAGADAVLPKGQARGPLLRLLYGDEERSALSQRPAPAPTRATHDAQRATRDARRRTGKAGRKRRHEIKHFCVRQVGAASAQPTCPSSSGLLSMWLARSRRTGRTRSRRRRAWSLAS